MVTKTKTNSLTTVPSGTDPVIRSNAKKFKVDLYQVGQKRKEVMVRNGQILAQVLDAAGVSVASGSSASDYDVRINSRPATFRTIVPEGASIYFASKVRGA